MLRQKKRACANESFMHTGYVFTAEQVSTPAHNGNYKTGIV